MPIRKPVVAGKFYQGHKRELEREVEDYLASGAAAGVKAPQGQAWGVMLPHAGHIYCGNVIGATLAGLKLPSRLIILCPNHTGYGQALGVWPDGEWLTPLGAVPVDGKLALELLQTRAGYLPDLQSHLGEHSIEVLLPFIQKAVEDPRIVPVSVGTRNAAFLKRAGAGLAEVLRSNPDAGVVVSSDMNHYESHETTLAKDGLALDKALALDPTGLLDVVDANDITMCGAGPMAMALFAARDLGYRGAELVDHTTSGPVSGDFGHTVGYAGVRMLKSDAA